MFKKRLTLSLACGVFLLAGTACLPHETVLKDPILDIDTGNYNAIAVDPAGRVHIAYRSDNVYDPSSDWVRYNRRDPATGWTEPLYADPTYARAKKGIAIATDSTKVYLASVLACSTKATDKKDANTIKENCTNSATGDLVLASCGLDGTSTEGCWTPGTPVVSGDVGDWVSLAASPDEALHLSYWKTSTSELIYRRRAPGGSAFGGISVIDTKVCSLVGCKSPKPFSVLKADDAKVHVAYRKVGPFGPLGARRERIVYKSRPVDGSGTWSNLVIAETSAAENEFGEKLDMALGADGTVHFCYFRKSDSKYNSESVGNMWYAKKSTNNGVVRFAIPAGNEELNHFYDTSAASEWTGCKIVMFDGKPVVFFAVYGLHIPKMLIAVTPDSSNVWKWLRVSSSSNPNEWMPDRDKWFLSAAADPLGRLHIAYNVCANTEPLVKGEVIHCAESYLTYLYVPGKTAACPVAGETPEEPPAVEPPAVGDPEDGTTGEVNDDNPGDTEEETSETVNEIDDIEDTTDDPADSDEPLIDDPTNLDLTEEENSGETDDSEEPAADPADDSELPPEVPAVRGGCSLIP